MAIRRSVAFGLAGAAVVVAALSLSGVLTFLFSFVVIVGQSLFPATISWDSKGAFVKCAGAIEHPAEWPQEPKAACAAMHMCANEAVLSERQTAKLAEAVRRTEGCAEL